jgi:very-short-patch-repair endonuclease
MRAPLPAGQTAYRFSMERKARISRARSPRAASTDAERAVWAALRGRQFEGLKFRRQVPIDRYFADFACVALKLIIELDGGQHADQIAYDEERTRVLHQCGWRVVRMTSWKTSTASPRPSCGKSRSSAAETSAIGWGRSPFPETAQPSPSQLRWAPPSPERATGFTDL